MPNDKTIEVRIPADMSDAIDRMAKARFTQRSSIVRHALASFLEREGFPVEPSTEGSDVSDDAHDAIARAAKQRRRR